MLAAWISIHSHANPPSITRQPSSLTVGAGVPATFSVNASPGSSFQWLRDGAPIDGATNAALIFTNTAFSDAANYSLLVGNEFGTNLSSSATLTILPGMRLSRVANIVTPGGPNEFYAYWVRVVGNLAIIADSQLQFYDISDPSTPVHLSTYSSTRGIFGFYVTNNLVYGLAGNYLEIVDFSDPRNPVRIGDRTYLNITATDIVVHDNLAYIASTGPFAIYDVSNPTNIVRRGVNNSYMGYTVQLIDNIAYLGGTDLGVPIFDVSNPALPLRTNILRPGYVDVVKIAGDRLYTAGSIFAVYDIRDRRRPRPLAEPVRAAAFASQGMSARGDFMFTGNKSTSTTQPRPYFSVFDAGDPSQLIEVARLTLSSNGPVENVDLVGDYVYFTSHRNLEIYKIEPSTNAPVLLRGIGNILTATNAPAELQAQATGGEQLTFQWFYNDTELPGQTNRSLRRAHVTAAETGEYSVRISNSAGSITNTGSLQLTAAPLFSPTISRGDARGPRLTLTLPAGFQTRLEATSNLTHWIEVTRMQSSGAATNLYDGPGLGEEWRFYRLNYGWD
jgi:hypothetical protein